MCEKKTFTVGKFKFSITIQSRETPARGTEYRWVWKDIKGPWKGYDWEVLEDGVFIVKQIIKKYWDFPAQGSVGK